MIMRKIYFSILTLILMMVSGSAMAQNPKLSELTVVNNDNPYVLTLNFKEGKEYEGIAVSAALDGVYDALGTTAADFDFAADAAAGKVYTQTATVTVAENIVTAIELNDELNDPAAASGGAWFGRSVINPSDEEKPVMSVPMSWGSKAQVAGEGDTKTDLLLCTFYLQNISLAEGTLTIGSTGQYPGVLKPGDTDYTYLYIANGTKAVKVKVQAEVAALADVKFNPSLAAHTNMLTPYAKNVDIHVVNGRDAEVSIDMSDVFGVLEGAGVKLEDVEDVVGQMLVAEKAANSEGDPSDVLLQMSAANWLAFMYDELNKKCFVPYQFPESTEYNVFEVWGASVDTEAKTLNFTVDLSSNYMDNGASQTVTLYVVYDTYALPITLTVTADTPPSVDDMVKVGEVDLDIEQEPAASGWPSKTYNFDLAKIAELLGCEPGEIDNVSCYKSESEYMDYPGVNDGWFDTDGYACSYDNGTIYVQPTGEHIGSAFLADGKVIVGQKGGAAALVAIQSETDRLDVPIKLLFIKGSNYVVFTVNFTAKLPEKSEEFELHEVGTLTDLVQMIPMEGRWNRYDGEYTLDINYITEKIGATAYTIYTDYYTYNAESEQETISWSKTQTLDGSFEQAFWFSNKLFDGFSVTTPYNTGKEDFTNGPWAWGWSYTGDGKYNLWQDNSPKAGDTYKANLYFVNDQTGAYVTYVLSIQYVESIIPSNVVGEFEDYEIYTDEPITLDMKAVYDMLEIEDGDLEVLWASSQTTYIDNISFQGMLDADGYVFDTDSGEDLPDDGITATYDEVDNTITIELNDENRYTEAESTDQNIIRLAFDYTTGEGDQAVTKRVIYTLTIVSEYTATGINSVKAEKATAKKAYNLAGQQVDKGYKGIVIEGGRKVLRK